MRERVMRVLEFDKIKAMLALCCRSESGRETVRMLQPEFGLAQVTALQDETDDAEAIYLHKGMNPVVEFSDVVPLTRRAAIGSTLSIRELRQFASFLHAVRATRTALVQGDDPDGFALNRIREMAKGLASARELEEEIFYCLIGEEDVSDAASAELSRIRRQVRLTNEKIRARLNEYLHSPQWSKYLQDPIVTMRNDRYVLPVKQEYRASVSGLIHDQSSSGATLFIEPMPIVEANNDLKELLSQEHREIERILAALSAKAALHDDESESNFHIMTRLDFAFAKAVLSRQMRAARPKLNDAGQLKIIRGRHPLLAESAVVPVDLHLGYDFSTLVITGPNTGGKTVTLKTVGLFALMAQCGLHLPCEVGSEMAVFDQLFADIGDEQSIEQSLSTFSSHMTNIVAILRDATPHSLVLFDELGAGTDPTEGAALGIAILEHFLRHGVRTVATTHYSELKSFAITTPGVENAAVEFNVETLRPTYKLSIGIPGKSNAFAISKRLGLDEALIETARSLLSQESIRFEDVIAGAEAYRQQAEKDREEAMRLREECDALQRKMEAQQKELDEKTKDILGKARAEARQVLAQARGEADELMKQIRKAQRATGEKGKAALEQTQQKKQALQRSLEHIEQSLSTPAPHRKGKPLQTVRVGESVHIADLNQVGTVLSAPDAGGEVLLQVGILKMHANVSRLSAAEAQDQFFPAGKPPISPRKLHLTMRTVGPEIDLHGQDVEEALMNLDAYLDDAFLASYTEVRVVHGKGTGALRQGIQHFLRGHPHVKSFRLGRYGEGESGVTVVVLQ